MQPQSTYKIISVKMKHPIFICKAIPVASPPELAPSPAPLHHNFFSKQDLIKSNKFSSPKLRQSIAQNPSIVPSPRLNYLVNRSSSCDLKNKSQSKKYLSPYLPQPKDQRGKQQKSIKQYLRLAYKRNEREKQKKGDRYKLPQIRKEEHKQSEKVQDEEVRTSNELENLTNMRQVLRRIRRKQKLPSHIVNPPPSGHQNQEVIDSLSGWQEQGNPQDFQH